MRAGVHAPTYRTWQMMKNRCLNPNALDYAYYGARGVTVVDDWLEYDGFLAGMGQRPDGLTLDRREGNLGYSPENCRWASRQMQARNRAYTLDLTFGGKTHKVWEWAEQLHIKPATLHVRLWRLTQGTITEQQAFAPNLRGTK